MLRAEGVEEYPADLICQTIGIAKSSYYNRLTNPETDKEKEQKEQAKKAKELFEKNNSEYGRKRLKKALNEAGIKVSNESDF